MVRTYLISDRHQRCLSRNEAYLSQCTKKTVKKSNGIIVSGCFTEHGIGLIHRVQQEVKVNEEEYIKILN